MSYKALGQGAESGWAQMAECLAAGGAWTGTECDYSGQIDIMAKQMCEGAGGTWDPVAKTCAVIGAPPLPTIPGTTPPSTPPVTPSTPPSMPPVPGTGGASACIAQGGNWDGTKCVFTPPGMPPATEKASIFGLPPLAVGLGAAAIGVVVVGALLKKKR